MSNLVEHAKRELALSLKADSNPGDPGYIPNDPLNGFNDLMRQNILELVEVFSSQNHSGLSSSVVLALFEQLARFENLEGLTDNPDDWILVSDDMWQCARNPSAFSWDGGSTYWLVTDPQRARHTSIHAD